LQKAADAITFSASDHRYESVIVEKEFACVAIYGKKEEGYYDLIPP